ncbi:arginine--tRNA ligase [Holospora obtusa F1]|uniref:Arginine--tRNA ligase n=1 Tax=Holospora obtusa F1 TaxID=1399147 RepID=W6TSC6_HOLOB|nr:arginine--tRNA ligase [Holospora obtusa]ETZ06732.1 arginine--tRNA ligase [Holospora obtusa F1]
MEEFLFKLQKWIENRLSQEGYVGMTLNFNLLAQRSHGDFTTSSAFSAAKQFQIDPIKIAQRIAFHAEQVQGVKRSVVAGPGFVNLTVESYLWGTWTQNILENSETYGRGASKDISVNIEYVSANPTGPLHVGHGRCAVVGDVLANIMQYAGYNVTREYYVNDAGNQITLLARSVYSAYKTLLGYVCEDSEVYPGDYIENIARELVQLHGREWLDVPVPIWESYVGSFAVQKVLFLIREDLEALNIRHDVFTCERFLHKNGEIDALFSQLSEKGWVYQGTMEAPKSSNSSVKEPKNEQLSLLRTTLWGDAQDRALCKQDGTWTYFAADLAYHMDKVRRGFSMCIDIFGADHSGHIMRLQGAIEALSAHCVHLEMICCQMVRFFFEKQPIKMSKRAGTYVSIQDILNYIDADTFRFFMVSKKADTHFDLDIQDMKSCTKDNGIFYIQYAHARCCSVLRRGKQIWSLQEGWWRNVKLSFWGKEHRECIGLALDFPRLIQSAAQTREPHVVCSGLYKLAQSFHSLWQKGNNQIELRFLDSQNSERSLANLVWIQAIAIALKQGLALLGIKAKEEL